MKVEQLMTREPRYGDKDELVVHDITRDPVHTVRTIVTETDFVNVAFQALSGLPLRGRGTPS